MTTNFCPHCGNETLTLQPPRCYTCSECAFHYYHNAAAATVAMIHCQGELLLAERAFDPGQGKLDLPGGFQEFGETLEEGLRRELYEELGLKIPEEKMRYLFSYSNRYPYKGIIYYSCDAYFEIEYDTKPKITVDDDVASVQWVPIDAIELNTIAFENMKRALSQRFNTMNLSVHRPHNAVDTR